MKWKEWISYLQLVGIGILIVLHFRSLQVPQKLELKSETEIRNEIIEKLDSIDRTIDTVHSVRDALDILRQP